MSSPVAMTAVWTAEHRLHRPEGEVWVGVRIDGTDVPERGEVIREALVSGGARLVGPEPCSEADLLAVHEPGYLAYLASAYDRWVQAGYPDEPGQDRVVPYVFPVPQAVAGLGRRPPAAVSALAGWYSTDTTTLIGPGTFQAAVAAASCALTATGSVLAGDRAAYAACRPPGHHAGPAFLGGSCYLNNAALAAQRFSSAGARVGVVDLDAHHGNGTQAVFYERDDVVYASVHVDPDAGWFPHFAGRAEETGSGAGLGANLNLPVPPGTGTPVWLAAVERACEAVTVADALVVSLGVDAHEHDPESPLKVDTVGYRAAGRAIGSLGKPTVFVQEGGYDLSTLGELVTATLAGFEETP